MPWAETANWAADVADCGVNTAGADGRTWA